MIQRAFITQWGTVVPWTSPRLVEPVVKQKKHNNTLLFKVQPTDVGAGEIHLKVEINCKEHFCVFPMVRVPFSVQNDWFTGKCEVLTYELDELIGTKVRALYQRLKIRTGCGQRLQRLPRVSRCLIVSAQAILRSSNQQGIFGLRRKLQTLLPQTLSILPPAAVRDAWKKDYQAMQESMIYEESPSFDRLIETLTALNRRINALTY